MVITGLWPIYDWLNSSRWCPKLCTTPEPSTRLVSCGSPVFTSESKHSLAAGTVNDEGAIERGWHALQRVCRISLVQRAQVASTSITLNIWTFAETDQTPKQAKRLCLQITAKGTLHLPPWGESSSVCIQLSDLERSSRSHHTWQQQASTRWFDGKQSIQQRFCSSPGAAQLAYLPGFTF